MNMKCGHVWTHWQMLKLRLPVCRFLSHLCKASQKCCPKERPGKGKDFWSTSYMVGILLTEPCHVGGITTVFTHGATQGWRKEAELPNLSQRLHGGAGVQTPVGLRWVNRVERRWCVVVGSTQIWVWNPVTILREFLSSLYLIYETEIAILTSLGCCKD